MAAFRMKGVVNPHAAPTIRKPSVHCRREGRGSLAIGSGSIAHGRAAGEAGRQVRNAQRSEVAASGRRNRPPRNEHRPQTRASFPSIKKKHLFTIFKIFRTSNVFGIQAQKMNCQAEQKCCIVDEQIIALSLEHRDRSKKSCTPLGVSKEASDKSLPYMALRKILALVL